MPMTPLHEIRDPIHGAIRLDRAERAVVEHPFVQRLRGIRQLGFAHVPFPGATHSRYAHSLGVMELAGQAFDAIFRDSPFSSRARQDSYRRCVRLAALCHDLGHGPFSHAAEFAMPGLSALGIDAYDAAHASPAAGADPDRQATHEDYTVGILTRSSFSSVIAENFDFTPRHVAALVSPHVPAGDDYFTDNGFDLRGIFSQLISSNLDADRLDYLVRDSYFTGASYGQIDLQWLISHLGRHIDEDGRVCLALEDRALYAMDDYMVARLHMFLMVYFHQKSVAYEHLLQRCMQSEGCDYRLPADMEAYRDVDDAHLLSWLRSSRDPWARRIVEMQPYKVAFEAHSDPGGVDLTLRQQALLDAGIDAWPSSLVGTIYQKRSPGKPPIYLLEQAVGVYRGRPLPEDRYQRRVNISRLYVPREQLADAYVVLEKMGPAPQQQRLL